MTHTSQRDQGANEPPHRPPPRNGGGAKNQRIWQMTHELRIPLTAMLGFAQLLLDPKSSKPLDQQQRGYVAQILDSGRQLLGVIDDILEVASVRAGRLPLAITPSDPRTLLTEVRDQLAPLAGEKMQRVTLHLTEALPPVKADYQQMRRVLLNLLGNAIKFAPPASEIVLGAQPAVGGATDFFVTNRGPVIPRAYHRRIFEPFAQVPQTQSNHDHGAGLGLAIAHDIVQSHGGAIWVRSNQRHGTTFWVRLPGEGPIGPTP